MVLLTLLFACAESPPDWGDSSCQWEESDNTGLIFSDGKRPKNLLIVSIDTLRHDHIGLYNPERSTPFLDTLGAESYRLDQDTSCSAWTYPSFICSLTGTRTSNHGFEPRIPVEALPDDIVTLAQRLKDHGFMTGLTTSNLFLSEHTGLDRGMDSSRVVAENVHGEHISITALEQVDALVKSGNPFFEHIHYIDPHAPYGPPEEYLDEVRALEPLEWDLATEEGHQSAASALKEDPDADHTLIIAHLAGRYAAEVAYIDDVLEALFDDLENMGALSDTLVVVMSDHGEQLSDHGEQGHNHSLFAEENRTTTWYWAHNLTPGSYTLPTQQIDIVPTLFDALGLPLPDVEGVVVGQADPDRDLFAVTRPSNKVPRQSLIRDCHKLLYNWKGNFMLYRIDIDPSEQSRLSDDALKVVTEMKDALLAEADRIDPLIDDYDAP